MAETKTVLDTAQKTKAAQYICIEGGDGSGKSTQTQKIVDHLRAQGFKVLHTKEPGTEHAPLTMELRRFMLDATYKDKLTDTGREFISQAIRSIHMEKCILPALTTYDYIIQDRGMLSGIVYGQACGNDFNFLLTLCDAVIKPFEKPWNQIYDKVVLLHGNPAVGLARAQACKQEFAGGDVIEGRGNNFMQTVHELMIQRHAQFFPKHPAIDVTGCSIDQVFERLLEVI
jgi:dTMP kinase